MSERESRIQQKLEGIRSQMERKVKQFDRPIVGWNPTPVERKEGETWTDDDGKIWTVKNGIKQSMSKLQAAKTPWWCPKCSKAMAHKFDDKFYRLYNMCYDCTLTEHTMMMLDGTWEAFERRKIRENEIAWLKDHITECKEYIRTFKVPQVHYENGGWDEIASINQFKELFDSINAEIKICEERLTALELEEHSEVVNNENTTTLHVHTT